MLKIILDEGVPNSLARFLKDFQVRSVQAEGWAGKKNCELLKLCESKNYEVFITLDTKMEYQQSLDKSTMKFIILKGITNRLVDLEPLFPKIVMILSAQNLAKKSYVLSKSTR